MQEFGTDLVQPTGQTFTQCWGSSTAKRLVRSDLINLCTRRGKRGLDFMNVGHRAESRFWPGHHQPSGD